MNARRFPALAVAGLILAGTAPVSAGDVAMIPTRITIAVSPGKDFTTLLHVQHLDDGTEGQTPFRVSLTEEDWTLSPHGRVDFHDGEPIAESARPWLYFSPGERTLAPGEEVQVRVSIVVPEGTAAGEYRAAIVAQPRTPYRPLGQGDVRLDMQLRLASMIYVQVPPVTRSAELTNLLVLSDGRQIYLEPEFSNRGQATARFFDSYEIYPAAEDSPVPGASRTAAAADPAAPEPVCRMAREEAGVALPSQVRYLRRNLPCDLGPGRYRLVYRAETEDDQPVLEGETEFVLPLPKEFVRLPEKSARPTLSRR